MDEGPGVVTENVKILDRLLNLGALRSIFPANSHHEIHFD